MRTRCLAIAVLLALAACSQSSGSDDPLVETASNLKNIESGTMTMSVTIAGKGGSTDDEVGFQLSGPFALPDEGALPLADLQYTQTRGADETIGRFIADGENAFVEVDGQAYVLPDDQTETFIGGPEAGEGDDILSSLDVSDWVEDPQISSDEDLNGEKVDKITGDLNVVEALNDLMSAAQSAGALDSFTPVEGEDRDQLESAVESASIEVLTGAEDRLLRRLVVEIDLGVPEDGEISGALAGLLDASFSFDLTIEKPNEDVEVSTPSDALPLDQLGT
ncbi:MAG: hypothetical protein QOG54_1740 [Actinomycetota bacterium]|jgi:hypothetical protein|nr:hypothetical protein [Actinomycetota bacterium]